jgi:hypothetical protein
VKKLVFLLLLLPVMVGCQLNKYVNFYSPGYTPAYQKQSQIDRGQQQQANSQSPATEIPADSDEG